MTETDSPHITHPPIVVSAVMPDDPPFRIVQIAGQIAGTAHSVIDVLEIIRRAGLEHIDLDDPAQVRWVGGDKFTWTPRPGPW
jgi:hypothetical protein